MNSNAYCCPHCKAILQDRDNSLSCINCKRSYADYGDFVDFLGSSNAYAGEIPRSEMQELLSNIDKLGFEGAIRLLLRQHPSLRSYLFVKRRVDWLGHCLGPNNHRVLDLGSGLGTISEALSGIYHEVYSLEAIKERIDFQIKRYKFNKRNNIQIIRANAIQLPFPDNFFDLVVCNGVLEWIGMLNPSLDPRLVQLTFLKEIKRVLTARGCLYTGIENRYGFQFLAGERDHSGLPFTSLMPRSLASFVVKKFGNAGGLYGDKSVKAQERKGYYTYTYSLRGFTSLFEEAGLRTRAYWVLPSYNEPYYSGNINDIYSISWFFRHWKDIYPAYRKLPLVYRIALSTASKLNGRLLQYLTKIFIPCFLFCSFKNEDHSLETRVIDETKCNSVFLLSGSSRLAYILLQGREPKEVVSLKRFGYDLPEHIMRYQRLFPDMADPQERVWIESWKHGRVIDGLKTDEVLLATKWLIDFKRSTTKKQVIDFKESHPLKRITLQSDKLNSEVQQKWIEEYEQHIGPLSLPLANEHGDFWYGNILIEPEGGAVNVVDWEHFCPAADQLYDFALFLMTLMMISGDPIHSFEAHLKGIGPATPVLKAAEEIINDYFGLKLNWIVIFRYSVLRFLARKQLEGSAFDETYNIYLSIAETLTRADSEGSYIK